MDCSIQIEQRLERVAFTVCGAARAFRESAKCCPRHGRTSNLSYFPVFLAAAPLAWAAHAMFTKKGHSTAALAKRCTPPMQETPSANNFGSSAEKGCERSTFLEKLQKNGPRLWTTFWKTNRAKRAKNDLEKKMEKASEKTLETILENVRKQAPETALNRAVEKMLEKSSGKSSTKEKRLQKKL